MGSEKMRIFRGLLLLVVSVGVVIGIPAAAQDEPAWWGDSVFYELFVRSFYDSDGDGIGDFNGITEKLDYLNDGDPATTDDLGVTGIWLMPIMESPSYHGYDVTEYYLVNDEYGTMEDFKALLDAAHARGIRVIIDLPFNHSSSQHPWFLTSQRGDNELDDWYLWEDENPGWRGPSSQQVWHSRAGRFYYALFWDGMPDLNYTNPDVTAMMYDVARFWLEDVGVDGFRLDAVKHVIEEGNVQENTDSTVAWMTAFQAHIHSINPDALVVGEIWSSTFSVAPYVEADAIDIAFEFDLAMAMLQSASGSRSSAVASAQSRSAEQFPDRRYGVFLTNHDQNRVADELRGNIDQMKLAAAMLLTAPGVPFIYYGEEIGMSGRKPDERIRTPMQWTADEATGGFTSGTVWEELQPDVAEVNVEAQDSDAESLLSTYRDLIHLRLANPVLQRGDYYEVESSERPVYSFIRADENGAALVIINLSDEAVEDYTLEFEGRLPVNVSGASMVYGDGDAESPELDDAGGFVDYKPLMSLAPFGVYIIGLTN